MTFSNLVLPLWAHIARSSAPRAGQTSGVPIKTSGVGALPYQSQPA